MNAGPAIARSAKVKQKKRKTPSLMIGNLDQRLSDLKKSETYAADNVKRPVKRKKNKQNIRRCNGEERSPIL